MKRRNDPKRLLKTGKEGLRDCYDDTNDNDDVLISFCYFSIVTERRFFVFTITNS